MGTGCLSRCMPWSAHTEPQRKPLRSNPMFRSLKRASPLFRGSLRTQARHVQSTKSFVHTNISYSAAKRFPASSVASFLGIALGLFYVSSVVRAEDDADDEPPALQEHEQQQDQQDSGRIKVEMYKYVIIGAGTAGHAALVAILHNDPTAKVLVLAGEHHVPYSRPPLTKDLWNSQDPNVAANLKYKNWEGEEATIWYDGVDYKNDTRVIFSTLKAIDLDPYGKAVLLEDETIAEYEKCLIATGGEPRVLPAGKGLDRVSTFRTVDDFRQIDQVAKHAEHIVIVGGGFLGSELAWGVSKKGVKVTQVFPEKGVLSTTFPDYLSDYVTDLGRKAGIDIQAERTVDTIESNSAGGVTVTLDNGVNLDADHVVMAAGITPANSLAHAADLEIDSVNGGIVVNPELSVRSDLYAAGDVASYFDSIIGVRRRIEHHDHAINSGKTAGENMTGARKPYNYLPFFWSDIGPVGFEAVGIVDSRLDKVGVWEKPEGVEEVGPNPEFKRGVIYYLKDNRVVGVLLLGVYGKVNTARTLIKRKQVVTNYESLQRAISLEEEEHH